MSHYEKEEGLYQVEKADERIVFHNLKKLNTEMMDLLMSESIGGNAQTEIIDGAEFGCAAANGYADKETGEILFFSNASEIPENLRDRAQRFTLRAAIVGKYLSPVNSHNDKPRIINFIEKENFSEIGRMSIQESIEQFNSQ